ncbi:hypothetical protein P3T36_000178 [Kitasatospora sp. MAP12-15]|uniref:phytanoyl-CoA dioxygenase family protein n=1 Tax=unclassified Kitasatospora TaxID=2633591 RepID=UPI002473B4A8|nr:phytanoyl-CoA dioxygenase family protein [Kitasatospora sp. MAP12-44]MDH6109406.1 hypothetical protein [Kitasatospora sp. MAP12-44]
MSHPGEFTLTEAEQQLLPTPQDVRFYAEHGWYLSQRLLSDEDLAILESASERFYAGERDRQLPLRPPRLADWQGADGDVQRHNDYIHYQDEAIARVLCRPLLGAVAARLAQAREIRVFQSTLILKPPRPQEPSNLVPWHCDRHYWQTCSSEQMLTAFVPFHRCDEEMGTITMVDGSHLWKEIAGDDSTRHFADRDRRELEEILAETARFNGTEVRKVPVVIPAGHVSFHHCRTYHGSGANVSARPRRAISLHLQDGANQWRPYRKPDGTQVVYNHDVLVRRTEDDRPDYADPAWCPTLWQDAR